MQFLEGRGISAPKGFKVGAARAGIKTSGLDVALLVGDEGTTAAAVFTTSQVKAAPVLVSAANLAGGNARAVIVNAGNANCCTGEAGMNNARRMCELAAQKSGLQAHEVLVCSTGIIGHALPVEKIETALESMQMNASDDEMARAFMTTDLVPKFVAAQIEIGGQVVTVGGQAKGVGMIGPNMAPLSLHATMLAFLTTDAQIEATRLQRLLESAVARSFNSVTVDGDMSTNDTAILLASGASKVEIKDDNEAQFLELLNAVCVELAKKSRATGEGATRLIQIEVAGTKTESDARQIALSIANSPLVKTAISGATRTGAASRWRREKRALRSTPRNFPFRSVNLKCSTTANPFRSIKKLPNFNSRMKTSSSACNSAKATRNGRHGRATSRMTTLKSTPNTTHRVQKSQHREAVLHPCDF